MWPKSPTDRVKMHHLVNDYSGGQGRVLTCQGLAVMCSDGGTFCTLHFTNMLSWRTRRVKRQHVEAVLLHVPQGVR